MKSLKTLAAPALLIAAVLLASSCGGGGKKGGPVSITIWEQMDPTEVDRFDRHLDEYMAAHPDVKIEHSHFDTENLRSQFQNAANAIKAAYNNNLLCP